jgi:hypothetical protein
MPVITFRPLQGKPTPTAEYSRLTLGLPRHGTCEQMSQFCAAAQPG